MSNLEEHDAEQAEITAMCESGECDHPECQVITYTLRVAMDVRAYGVANIEATCPEQAQELATAEYIAANFEPHGSGSDDYDFSHPRAIWLELAENTETGDETDLSHDVAPGEWERKTAPIITTKATSGDTTQAIEVLWEALAALREDLIPEGDESYDAQWDEITTAMAWITEALA